MLLSKKTANTLHIEWLLQSHKKGTDYCYFLLRLCNLIPNYCWKQRAIGVIRLFLNRSHLPYASRYTFKIHADADKESIKKWCHQCIKGAGKHRPHWKQHITEKLNFVEIPKSTWNLKMVNVQRKNKDYVWKKETNGTRISLATAIPDASKPDLLRIPANSNTRVLEE